MNRLLLFVLAIFVSIPLTFASFAIDIDENVTFYSVTTDGNVLTDASNATISIQQSNGTFIVQNRNMTLNGTGTYLYSIKLNTTGTHKAIITTTRNSVTYERQQYFTAERGTMTQLAIILGLMGFIFYLVYIAKDAMSKPEVKDPAHRDLFKWFNPKNVGFSLFLLSSWLVVGMLAVITSMSEGSNYYGIVRTMFYASLLVIGAFNVSYFILYILFTIKTQIDQFVKR